MPRIDTVETGKRIRYLRTQEGLTIRELREVFGFGSASTIYKWENGQSIPSIDNLVILSSLFQVPIESIICVKE